MHKSLHIFWIFVLAFGISSCSKQIYTSDIDTSYYSINPRNETDQALDALIEPYRSQLDAKMKEVIAYNVKEMTKDRPSSTLGNWFADAFLAGAEFESKKEIDIAMQNYGGIRVPFLKQGDITVGHIYELMPFDNSLVILTMDGELLQQLLDKLAEKGGWPISNTLHFSIDEGKATEIFIKEQPIVMSKKYTVALPDYIANGGDNCFFLDRAERQDFDMMIRDLLIDYLKRKPSNEKNIQADESPRILIAHND